MEDEARISVGIFNCGHKNYHGTVLHSDYIVGIFNGQCTIVYGCNLVPFKSSSLLGLKLKSDKGAKMKNYNAFCGFFCYPSGCPHSMLLRKNPGSTENS